MSSLADLPDLVGFFSYARSDDRHSRGALSLLREHIHSELQLQLGRRSLRLWQDKDAIPFGTLWQEQIEEAIAESAFFIPIVSPAALDSDHCRIEFRAFLERESELQRKDLIFPILYIEVDGLAKTDQLDVDDVLKSIHARQYADWTKIRLDDADSSAVKKEVARFCRGIVAALRKTPEDRHRMEEAEARRLKEQDEDSRDTEPEPRRSADEERPHAADAGAQRQGQQEDTERRAFVRSPAFALVATIFSLAVAVLIFGWVAISQETAVLAPEHPAVLQEPPVVTPTQSADLQASPEVPSDQFATLSVDAAGTCPGDEFLALFNPEIDGTVLSQRSRTGSPVRPDVLLYRNQSLTGPKVDKPASGYDDDFIVMVGAKLGTTGSALVRRIRDSVCGWMDVRDLERSAVPLKLINLPGFERRVDLGFTPSRLDARVLVKNRVDQQTGDLQRAPIFREPFDGPEPPESERLRNVGYFEVLSVFEVRKKNGRCRILSEDGCFLKVGTTDAGRARGTFLQGTRTRGWVSGKDVEVWPSPLALYYKPGTEGLKIHGTESSARNGTPYAERGAETRILAFQPPGRYAEPRDANIMRFPVIRSMPAGSQRPLSRPDEHAAMPSVYEILLNRACLERGRGCLPDAGVARVLQMISKIDVLFVVDANESAEPYQQSVMAAIKKQVDELATAPDPASLRYSIVLYGDYNEKRYDHLDYFALPFSPVSDRSAMERLLFVKSYDDIHKDLPGAPFAALERAVLQAQWRPDAAHRLIIWIGERGSRPTGTYRTNGGYTLVEDKTAQNVIAAIRVVDEQMKSASPIGTGTKTRFVALQVKGGARAPHQEELTKFRTDAETISSALGEDIFKTTSISANLGGKAEVAALTDAITAQIAVNVNTVTQARNALLGVLSGNAAWLGSRLANSQLASEYLLQLGFNVREVMQPGFVFQDGANGDFSYWLGLRRPEFENFRHTVTELCESLPYYGERGEAIEEAVLKLLKLLTFGDPRQDENMRDYLARALGIPADYISTVLEGTPNQFIRRLSQPAERPNVITKVCRSAKLLNIVEEGQTVDNPQDVVVATEGAKIGRATLRPGVTPRPFDWRWISPEAQAQWYFVPMDYLP
jgi:hypothetical protein